MRKDSKSFKKRPLRRFSDELDMKAKPKKELVIHDPMVKSFMKLDHEAIRDASLSELREILSPYEKMLKIDDIDRTPKYKILKAYNNVMENM